MAAGVGGLRATGGGNAACWRVAGAIAALGAVEGAEIVVAAGLDVVLAAALSAVFSVALGATLRAIGRGFGNGILCLAAVSFAHACDPTIRASVVAMAVERNAAKRADRVTAFLCDESRKTNVLRSSRLNMWKKHPIRGEGILCVITAAKSRPARRV
jgi:hypothetical protein